MLTISLAVGEAEGMAVEQLLDSSEWEKGVRGGGLGRPNRYYEVDCGFVAPESNKECC